MEILGESNVYEMLKHLHPKCVNGKNSCINDIVQIHDVCITLVSWKAQVRSNFPKKTQS
jgi:hypothetical protein